MVFAIGHFFDLAVDDLVGNPNLCEHRGGLAQKFDAVGQNEHTLACLQDVPLRQFRKNHRFSASGGQLIQEVVFRGKFP